MTKQRIFAAGLIFLFLGGAGIVLCLPHHLPQTWTLPDGSTLRLVKVTYGTNHYCIYGHRLQDLLYPLVPARYRTNFNFQVATIPSTHWEEKVFWIERTGLPVRANPALPTGSGSLGAATNAIVTATGIPTGWNIRGCHWFRVFDDSGVESNTETSRAWNLGAGNAELEVFRLGRHPRRAKTIGIRLYGNYLATNLVAELHLPNPHPQSPSDWVAETMPATRQTNGLAVTLSQLATGYAVAHTDLSRSSSFAQVAVREHGQLTTDWSVLGIDIINASGKYTDIPAFGRNVDWLLFSCPLWLEEPAWRVRVTLARTAMFPTEQTWTIGLPLTEDGRSQALNLKTNLLGEEVTLTSMAAQPPPQTPATWQFEPVPGVNLAITAPESLRLTPVEWRDDSVHRNIFLSYSQVSPAPGTQAAVQPALEKLGLYFRTRDDATNATLTVGITRKVVVEFLVKPVLAGTGGSPPWNNPAFDAQ